MSVKTECVLSNQFATSYINIYQEAKKIQSACCKFGQYLSRSITFFFFIIQSALFSVLSRSKKSGMYFIDQIS